MIQIINVFGWPGARMLLEHSARLRIDDTEAALRDVLDQAPEEARLRSGGESLTPYGKCRRPFARCANGLQATRKGLEPSTLRSTV